MFEASCTQSITSFPIKASLLSPPQHHFLPHLCDVLDVKIEAEILLRGKGVGVARCTHLYKEGEELRGGRLPGLAVPLHPGLRPRLTPDDMQLENSGFKRQSMLVPPCDAA